MHLFCIISIPIFAVFIAAAATYVCSRQLRSHLKTFFVPANTPSDEEKSKLVDEHVEAIIAKHLDDVVTSFKSQIPMAGMLLGQAREEKLKEQARKELFKAVPAIKAVVVNPQTVKFTDRLWRSVTFSLMGMAALIGLFLGLVQLGLIMLFC